MHFLFLIILSTFFFRNVLGVLEINVNKTIIWGPGLSPDKIILPARYFFIQAVDNEGNYINSRLANNFKVTISGTNTNNNLCRVLPNILDRKNGSYIVRYKIYDICKNLKIEIKYDDEDVGKSPYIIKNTVYPDECNCLSLNIEEFKNTWGCSKVPHQIIKDLSMFGNINWDILRPKIIKEFDQPYSVSLCNYVIKQNKIYRKCYGQYVGFKMFMDNLLLSLSRKIVLPDVEIFVNLGDWPLVKFENGNNTFPIFSWCASKDSFDIVMPTYDITESSLENMGRVMLDILSVQGNVKIPWTDRIPKAFWRGRDSSRERLKLIDIARENSNLINASLTNFFFFRDKESHYGPKTEHVSFFNFFNYKYQLNLDGTVAAYRFPYLLAGGSLTLKQESKYYEHFYHDLKPYVHYIPVKENLEDLVEKLQWAIDNDEKSQTIAKNAQIFVNEKLLPHHILCYYVHLIYEMSEKIVSPIRVHDGMELVVEENSKRKCSCRNNERDEL